MKKEKIVKKSELKKCNCKKLFIYGIIGAVVALLVIALLFLLPKGPKKTVKNFVNGMNKQDSSKITESLDFIGMRAWGYYFNEKEFSEKDYEEFIGNYEQISRDIDDDEIKEEKEYLKETADESFENGKYKSCKIKIKKFEDIKELGEDLYAIDTKISMKTETKDQEEILTFIIYKEKVVYAGGIGF